MRLLGPLLTLALTITPVFSARAAMLEDATPPQRDEQERVRRLSITMNPLAVALQRYGGNIEIVPARHHVFVLSGFVQRYSLDMVRRFLPSEVHDYLGNGETFSPGGEVGYRLYSGSTGADGVFLGPSFVVTPLAYPRLATGPTVELVPFYASGLALDIGAQTVTGIGLTIGGGVGVQYLSYRLPDDPYRIPIDFTPRVLPRLLMTAGWSF